MKMQSHELANALIVHIPINSLELEGKLVLPPKAKGLVIFAHGSSSSRHSSRNTFVAQQLRKEPLATLLVDLLSEEEDSDYQRRFDIGLLTERLVAITDWAAHYELTKHLNIGYFGASTGAAAAMLAAVGAEDVVKAIVSRGGRVDLAYEATDTLRVPTLLIVGQQDHGVREANEEVFLKLKGKKELAEIPYATHLFEEPGALGRVAGLASEWFKEYLSQAYQCQGMI
jgi:putative phosphoribosyl transferase